MMEALEKTKSSTNDSATRDWNKKVEDFSNSVDKMYKIANGEKKQNTRNEGKDDPEIVPDNTNKK